MALGRAFQSILSWAQRVAPGVYLRVAWHIVSRMHDSQLLETVLARLPIRSYTVAGAQGIFEGAAEDLSVIGRYATARTWSPEMVATVQAFFKDKPDGVYLDIGANIGLTAVPIAASGIKTIAFEPVPANFAFLSRNVELNACGSTIELVNAALLDKSGTVSFELSPTNHGDHRVRRQTGVSMLGEDRWNTVSVSGRTLDEWLPSTRGPLAIKIDTQGSEPLVFAGGEQVFAKAGLLICEVSPYAMHRMGADPKAFFDYIATFDRIDISERESEEVVRTLDGTEARAFLLQYHAEHLRDPIGCYVNIVARR